jgi:TPR repeat protein
LGEPQSQFNLGVFYEQGQVVPQDFTEAVKWYRRAAEQEIAPAQCNLGLCYQTGRGVPQDMPEAVRWFIRAARQGDKTAQHNLGVYYATQKEEPAVETEAEATTEQSESADQPEGGRV